MNRTHDVNFGKVCFPAILVLLTLAPAQLVAEPTAAATGAFNAYADGVERRLAREHESAGSIIASVDSARVRQGELVTENLKPAQSKDLDGTLLQDWRGTAFVAGAKAADFDRVMKDFPAFPQTFSPQILRASATTEPGDKYEVMMRVRQKHIITVVLDMDYDTRFARVDADGRARGYSISRSTRVAEIEAPGTLQERVLAPDQDRGFLWRINNYWTYEERDGGLYLQVESVTLSRSAPAGLGWAVKPFIQSVPRESLEFTLRSLCAALRR